MAQGIGSIATVVKAAAIRKRTVEHGRDPRDFVLFAYGGNGPLHAVALARELSIPTVVVPPEPGNFSASGMLIADARLDTSQTFVGRLDATITSAVDEAFLAMEATALEAIRREIKADAVTFERQLEMRYRGQRHNIKVAITNLSDPAAIREAFERDYRRRYGHSDERAPVEVQALHLSAVARLRRPELARMTRPQAPGSAARGTRKVYFEQGHGAVDTPVFDRFALSPGFKGTGPAVIEEYGSTTIIWPGDRFEIGTLGEIRIDCRQVS
jgi:N-methylhydantoinase A